MRLKICDSHLTYKVANKCLNVREQVEVVEWNKMVPSLSLLSCELLVSAKENPDRKKKAYISKHNDKRNNQVNLLMITDGTTNWHYLGIKNISGSLRGITSNHNSDFYCLNCLHSYRTKSKLKKHDKICKNHDFLQSKNARC